MKNKIAIACVRFAEEFGWLTFVSDDIVDQYLSIQIRRHPFVPLIERAAVKFAAARESGGPLVVIPLILLCAALTYGVVFLLYMLISIFCNCGI